MRHVAFILNRGFKAGLALGLGWLLAGCMAGPRVYPPSDDLLGSTAYAVPREFKNGTATLTNVFDWSGSLLGLGRPLKTKNEDINRDGRPELLVSQPANAGTGGNEYFIFKATPKGYRFLGDLWFGGLQVVSPDRQGCPRLITFSSVSSGSGRVALCFLDRDGFHEIKGRMLPYGDGPHAEGRDWLVELLVDRETGKDKEPTEATLDLIFGDPMTIHFSGSVKAGERFERPFGGRFTFVLKSIEHGWGIYVYEKGRKDNLANLTLPLHGPNPTDIEGWHFRNDDNTEPGTMHSSVFSQENREFVFSPEVGKVINGPRATNDISDDDLNRIGAFGEGELKITDLKLSPPRAGETADIRRMKFDCKLTWRQKDLEPRGTNKVSLP